MFEKNKNKNMVQYKPCSPFVYVDTLWLLDCMRKYFDKGDIGRFLFEIYFKTPCFAAAFKDFLDVEVCNAGEAIRSLKSIKKNVLNLKDSDECVLKIFEELMRRKYLWYSIEYASNGEPMIHYILLNYSVGNTIVFKKMNSVDDTGKIPFEIETSKWIRKGSYNPKTKEVTIERIPIFEIEEIERKSIYNAKPDDVISICRNVFNRRVNFNHSDSVEKILFKNSADFNDEFVNEVETIDEIPLDEGEAFLELISCTVCRDIDNPVSFFAPALTIENEIIFNNEFFSERWNWNDEERVGMFFGKVKDVFLKKEVLNGRGFVILIKIPGMIEPPVFPDNQHFDKVFEKIMPTQVEDKEELKEFVKNNVDTFVQSYFYRGSLCPDGKGREYFDEYTMSEYKKRRKCK